jgi:hypothetical protein
MFADDIVLLSENALGLQNVLNNFHSYCRRWKLTININKTKFIIFNEGGHHISKHNFSQGNLKVEIIQSYCYLGIIFSALGNVNNKTGINTF